MSPLEIAATLFGLANIILIIRRIVWNYPFALVMVSLYAFIFWEAKLYSDAGLQLFFFVVNVAGWWSWSQNRAEAGEVVVSRLGGNERLLWVAGSILAILVWGSLMARFTDASFPYWDGAVAMLSVAGQILMVRRRIENWYWWIAVNAISIPLYIVKELYLTAGLYGLFLALAIWGLISWERAKK